MPITNLTWTSVAPAFTIAANTSVTAAWVVAVEHFDPAWTHLKLKAQGQWTALNGLSKCGPDGLVGRSFPEDRLLLADCAVGALIGRIGGSSAALKAMAPAVDAGEGKPFAVGSHTVLKLPDNFLGPLYIGFNIIFRPIAVESLTVDVQSGS